MSYAKIKKWVPTYTLPGQPDFFYIHNLLFTLWSEPDGSLPRHGNPEDPLDDLIYLMLSRRGRIAHAQPVFESLRASLTRGQGKKPDWASFIRQGPEEMARPFNRLGLGLTRARELHAALSRIQETFGKLTLDPLKKWHNKGCLEFLCSLPGVSFKTAACVMLYALRRDIFPADVHCNRVLARLGVIPAEYGHQEQHKKSQQLLLDGRIPKGMAFSLHVTLVRHGQEICTPRAPKCHICPLRGFCADYRRRVSEEWATTGRQPSCVDLFCGAGGTSVGLSRPIEWGHDPRAKKARTIRIALAAEHDPWAHKTYVTNHPEIPFERVLQADLTDEEVQKRIKRLLASERNLVLVIGGPPCQNVSLIGTTGRRVATSEHCRFASDTYNAFRDIVRMLRTRFFVMENVPGLLAANQGSAREDILNDFSDIYATNCIQVEAHDHGLPQRRQRILTVGVLKEGAPRVAEKALAFLIEQIHAPLERIPWTATLGQAVSDLPPLKPSGGLEFDRCPSVDGGEGTERQALTAYQQVMRNGSGLIYNHVARPNNERDIQLYNLLGPGEVGADAHRKYRRPDLMIYRNDIFHDKYRRQVWDEPSTTIVAHLAKDGHMFIHPKQVRSITVREAARLQSFPDDFIFLGPRTQQFRQVGNAVPPLLGARIRSAVLKTLTRFYPRTPAE